MESTACGKECPFVKQGFCQHDHECPHYVESWWIEAEGKQPRILRDCSPKRLLLQQQVLQSKVESLQQALEQSRNESHQLMQYLKTIIQASRQVLNHNQKELSNEIHPNKLIDVCPE